MVCLSFSLPLAGIGYHLCLRILVYLVIYDSGYVSLGHLLAKEEMRLERDFFIDNLLVRVPCIIVMIRWTGLAPWEFGFPFPGSRVSTFLGLVPPVHFAPPLLLAAVVLNLRILVYSVTYDSG